MWCTIHRNCWHKKWNITTSNFRPYCLCMHHLQITANCQMQHQHIYACENQIGERPKCPAWHFVCLVQGKQPELHQLWQCLSFSFPAAYLCRWCHFLCNLACRHSCAHPRCWNRVHFHHSCAGLSHIRHALKRKARIGWSWIFKNF